MMNVDALYNKKQLKDMLEMFGPLLVSKDEEMVATRSKDKGVILYRRYKESPEERKERFEKRGSATGKEFQEKAKLLFLVYSSKLSPVVKIVVSLTCK